MTIKVNVAIYIVVALALLIWFIVDLFREESGGMFWPGKRKGDLGFGGLFAGLLLIMFTLVWGGFFWW
jgi:hypothetical protein